MTPKHLKYRALMFAGVHGYTLNTNSPGMHYPLWQKQLFKAIKSKSRKIHKGDTPYFSCHLAVAYYL